MRPNEVVRYREGYRLRVLLPGEPRRRTIPPTYTNPAVAIAALDLWNSDVDEVEIPTCKHEILRTTCGLCAGMAADMSYAGAPANEHRGGNQPMPVGYDSRTGGFIVSADQKIVDQADWAAKRREQVLSEGAHLAPRGEDVGAQPA